MAVVISGGVTAHASAEETSYLRLENGSRLLQEDGGKLILELPYPLTHARIAHSGNWLTGGVAAVSSVAVGYFADAPLNSLTYEIWQPVSMVTDQTWEYQHTGSASANYCCIGAHTLGTSGCSVKVQYYEAGGWIDLTTTHTPPDDSPIFFMFPEQAATRWRIYLSGGSAPEIAVVKFGVALEIPRPMFGGHSPITLARSTVLRSNRSETGEYLGRTKQRAINSTAYQWRHLTNAWVRANWPSLQRAIEAEPFFIAWRPLDYPDVAFAQVDEVPVPTNMGIRDLMEVTMSIRARAYD